MDTLRNLVVVYLYFVTLALYLYIGPEVFPDYVTYMRIAYQGFASTGFVTEFFTRYLLYNDLLAGLGINRVDTLTLFVHYYTIIILLTCLILKPQSSNAILIFSCLYFPLFLTTTLRATPLYVTFFAFSLLFFRKKISFVCIFTLLLIGVNFHDSVFLLVTVLLISLLIVKIGFKLTLISKLLVALSPIIIFLTPILLDAILGVFSLFPLGDRASYLLYDRTTVGKTLYLLFICIVSGLFVFDIKQHIVSRVICASFCFCIAFIAIMTQTVAVRLSMFLLVFVFATRLVFFDKLELSIANFKFILPIYFTIFILNFYVLL